MRKKVVIYSVLLVILILCLGWMIGCGGDSSGPVPTSILPTPTPSKLTTIDMPPSDMTKLVKDTETGLEMIRNEVLVYFKEGVSDSDMQKSVAAVNGTIVGHILDIRLYKVQIPDTTDLTNLKNAIQTLKADSNVEQAIYNSKVDTASISASVFETNDSQYSNWSDDDKNYGLRMIDAPMAWDLEIGNLDTKIGIIDVGFDVNQEDLVDNIYSASSVSVADHGTHVAGIISARGNNGKGIAGVCWLSKLMLYRIQDLDAGTITSIISAVKDGAKVVNLSIGTNFGPNKIPLDSTWKTTTMPNREQLYRPVFSFVKANNVLLVYAAGNDADDPGIGAGYGEAQYDAPKRLVVEYPDNIILVAACDVNSKIAYFSNYGKEVEISAPGVDIYSTLPNNKYGGPGWSGTSMAAPYVTGLAGLIWAHNPSLTSGAVKQYIIQGAKNGGKSFVDPLGNTIYIINAYESLKLTPPVNNAPVAVLLADTTSSGGAPVTIHFDGSKSHAPSGTESIQSYGIDFGDGNSSLTGKSWTHTYNSTGTYTARLTITDKNGLTDSDTLEISIGSSYVNIIVNKEEE